MPIKHQCTIGSNGYHPMTRLYIRSKTGKREMRPWAWLCELHGIIHQGDFRHKLWLLTSQESRF